MLQRRERGTSGDGEFKTHSRSLLVRGVENGAE